MQAKFEGSDVSTRSKLIQEGCEEVLANTCKPETCKNGGICRSKMYGFTCDCVNTSFKGDTCEIGKNSNTFLLNFTKK